jgi:glycine cleavage system H protein
MASSRPKEYRYTESHEWVRVEGGVAVIGITDFAVEHLSDLTFLSLPENGAKLEARKPFGEIESVKAVAELNCPVSGSVISVNSSLIDALDRVVESPFEEGWMIKVKMTNPSDLKSLMDVSAYEEHLKTED